MVPLHTLSKTPLDSEMPVTTPSEALSEVIVPLLVEGKLFLPDDATKSMAKIAAGGMKPEDWLLAAEKALDKECSQ